MSPAGQGNQGIGALTPNASRNFGKNKKNAGNDSLITEKSRSIGPAGKTESPMTPDQNNSDGQKTLSFGKA